MPAGVVDGATMIAAAAEKKCATDVFPARERAVRRLLDLPPNN